MVKFGGNRQRPGPFGDFITAIIEIAPVAEPDSLNTSRKRELICQSPTAIALVPLIAGRPN